MAKVDVVKVLLIIKFLHWRYIPFSWRLGIILAHTAQMRS
ncbi:hypothetical protein BN439_2171 [Erwinia amylovora Ea644]|nr:hypothetical protein BN439_2171 [Erwinia amylovora Ea644]CCP07232.1 hypothetical protein BN440_2209 [Erwinia amylovora MR1]